MKNQDSSRRLKAGECIVIALLLLAGAAGYFLTASSQGGTAVIKADGILLERLPLDKDTSYRPDGYDIEFTVSGGRICVSEAGCPDKVCMHTGYISSSFQSIVCLPFKITVTIESEETSDIDVVL